ncbi:MAG: response regulator transcription factor [Wenzhouxiangellaceae bacterium]
MNAAPESRRLLIVEDDSIFADVLAGAMAARGYECTTFHELEQAEAYLEKQPHPFAYAVLDLNLDGQSSLPLIQPLKTGRPDMRILVLTGYASIATAVEAVKLGADEYLTKPADADQIERALAGATTVIPSPDAPSQPMSVRRLEWEHLQRVLTECDGNVSEAARRLNMHRRTLQRKLAKKPVAR